MDETTKKKIDDLIETYAAWLFWWKAPFAVFFPSTIPQLVVYQNAISLRRVAAELL